MLGRLPTVFDDDGGKYQLIGGDGLDWFFGDDHDRLSDYELNEYFGWRFIMGRPIGVRFRAWFNIATAL